MIQQSPTVRETGRAVAGWTLAVAATAWLLLWGLTLSPLRASLHSHGQNGASANKLAFLGAWLLMVAAMMLPASVDFVRVLHRLVSRRPHGRVLLATGIGGFGLAWLSVGQFFQGGDAGLHELVGGWPWLDHHRYLITAAALGLAGAYQLSPAKRRCLSACRSPAGFVARGWHGSHPTREMARIGLAYGASCIGCCWALMLVMFASGVASLWLMVGLTALMVAERRVRQIDPLVPTIAVAFVVASVLVATGVLPGFAAT